jgi:hypothetical protein
MKHLDKFYNQKDVPWVKLVQNALYQNGQIPHATTDKGSFWWRDLLKLCDMFRGISSCIVGNGSTVLFKLHMYGTIYVSPPCSLPVDLEVQMLQQTEEFSPGSY